MLLSNSLLFRPCRLRSIDPAVDACVEEDGELGPEEVEEEEWECATGGLSREALRSGVAVETTAIAAAAAEGGEERDGEEEEDGMGEGDDLPRWW